MKKILITVLLFILSINISFSYETNSIEKENVDKIIQILDKKYSNKTEKWYKNIIESINLQIIKDDIKDDKKYLLEEVKKYFEDKIDFKKQEIIENKLYTERKEKAKVPDEIFFNTYWQEIVTELKVKENCTKYYKEIDKIAYKNDFPTEIIISMWDMEYWCTLWNPTNGWWPFQITSKYYQPWKITLEQFLFEVQDFIDFSKGKWNYFNTNNYVDYKQRFWEENIDIKYDKYTIRELRLHSVLYAWITKNVTLDQWPFTNWNLNKDVVSDVDWIITKFLKVLDWKNNN